jgi:hypothetical protein
VYVLSFVSSLTSVTDSGKFTEPILVSLRYILTEYLHQVVGDNKSTIEELIIQTAERWLAMDMAVDQGFPDSAKPQITAFIM